MKDKMSQYKRYCRILSVLTSPFPNFEPEEFRFLCPLASLCEAPNFLGSSPEFLPDSEYKKERSLVIILQEDTVLKVIYCSIKDSQYSTTLSGVLDASPIDWKLHRSRITCGMLLKMQWLFSIKWNCKISIINWKW
jgi:hypothetical protein